MMNRCPLDKTTRNLPINICSRIEDIQRLWKKADKCDISLSDASFLEETARKAQDHISKLILYSQVISDEKRNAFEEDVNAMLDIVETALETLIKNKNSVDSAQIKTNVTVTKQKATLDGLSEQKIGFF